MPKRLLIVSLVALSTLACASTRSDSGLGNAKVDVIKPELLIVQTSSVPVVARHVEGAIPVQYRLTVLNHYSKAITLKQISVQSVGYGAYTLNPTSRPFKTTVEPEATQVVEFWAPANIENVSLVGANGPVTLRLTAFFDSPVGQFQEMVVQQVNARTGVDGSNQQ